MKQFFSDEQRTIIKEAIEDHRASLIGKPRSDYGKIVSSADKNVDILNIMKRTHLYSIKHYPELSLDELIKRAYNHLTEKFGELGYAQIYVKDTEYQKFKKDIKELLNNKYLFAKKYMEYNEIIDIKEQAKLFAIEAHKGQVRKNETDKPMIIHPIGVAMLLENYGYDDNVVAAGYLHDVVEDTKYTIENIEDEFGKDISTLVMCASEPDKSLSWEERKQHTIEKTKKLSFRNKLVICADKINNLEDVLFKFEKTGQRDFSAFNRGEEKQRWYYTGVYESLIFGEDSSLPIFQRLKDVIDKLFYKKEDTFLRDTIFENSDYYQKLKILNAQKTELQKLKDLCHLPKPFIIEFCGTPRTGKTTTINNLYDFFKKGGFKISIVEEFTTSKYYKENLKLTFDKKNEGDRNIAIIEEVHKQLLNSIKSDLDIILIDRSINDRQIWNYRRFTGGYMPQKQYQEAREKYLSVSKELIDFLVITYTDSLTCIKRDYNSSLSLEKRNFLNIKNVDEYNKALFGVKDLFDESVENSYLLDTTNMALNDISVQVASQIMPIMRQKYIDNLKMIY